LIGDFYDYDDDRLTPDQTNKAKKINMAKNQLESLLVSVSLHRLFYASMMARCHEVAGSVEEANMVRVDQTGREPTLSSMQ
jgi:hypothetical protein